VRLCFGHYDRTRNGGAGIVVKPEWKEKWLAALESGQYEQTQGTLRDNADIRRAFCPLGMLCDLANVKWTPSRSAYLGPNLIAEGGVLTPEGEWHFGLKRTEVDAIVVMNDEKQLPLDQIAAYIRANF
jgi:hypothetical protein